MVEVEEVYAKNPPAERQKDWGVLERGTGDSAMAIGAACNAKRKSFFLQNVVVELLIDGRPGCGEVRGSHVMEGCVVH